MANDKSNNEETGPTFDRDTIKEKIEGKGYGRYKLVVPKGTALAWATTSTEELDIGDMVTKEGYVWKFRIDEPDFPLLSYSEWAASVLDRRTYFIVTIREKSESEEKAEEFRLLWQNQSGEELAASMALIATLKDAFLHKKRVKVHGRISEEIIGGPAPFMEAPSDPFRALKSVEITD